MTLKPAIRTFFGIPLAFAISLKIHSEMENLPSQRGKERMENMEKSGKAVLNSHLQSTDNVKSDKNQKLMEN